MRAVIDTNVLVAGLRSRHGASHLLLQYIGTRRFEHVVTTPLCVEYEAVLNRPHLLPNLTPSDVSVYLSFFLVHAVPCRVHFLWRPHLPDEKDDLVLEAALAGQAEYIVTHNHKHFREAVSLGIRAVTPDRFMRMVLSK